MLITKNAVYNITFLKFVLLLEGLLLLSENIALTCSYTLRFYLINIHSIHSTAIIKINKFQNLIFPAVLNIDLDFFSLVRSFRLWLLMNRK